MIFFGFAIDTNKLTRDEADLLDSDPHYHMGYSANGCQPDIAIYGVEIPDTQDDLFNPVYLDDISILSDCSKTNFVKVGFSSVYNKLPESIIQKFDRPYPSLISIVLSDD